MDSKSGLRNKRSKQLLILRQVNSNALSIRYQCGELRRLGVNGRVCDYLPSKSDLLAERRSRDVLALSRVGEATLLRDSDKVSELMNLHRTILSCERRFVEAADRRRARPRHSQPPQVFASPAPKPTRML